MEADKIIFEISLSSRIRHFDSLISLLGNTVQPILIKNKLLWRHDEIHGCHSRVQRIKLNTQSATPETTPDVWIQIQTLKTREPAGRGGSRLQS